jgi:hypothetical protein
MLLQHRKRVRIKVSDFHQSKGWMDGWMDGLLDGWMWSRVMFCFLILSFVVAARRLEHHGVSV